MADIQRIEFHGQYLESWQDERTGRVYVVPRRITDTFGLGWPAQYAKLTKNQLYTKGVTKIITPSAGGNQEVIGLDLELFPAWLLSISVNRVKEEYREALLLYQEESAKVLRDYWFRGQAIRPRVKDPALQAIIAMSDQVKSLVIELDSTREEARHAKETAEHSKDLALQALQSQMWLPIAQYVIIHGLERQVPPPLQNQYGRWLTGYCQERGLPVYEIRNIKGYAENTYHVQVIQQTLPPWLTRRQGQANLLGISGEN